MEQMVKRKRGLLFAIIGVGIILILAVIIGVIALGGSDSRKLQEQLDLGAKYLDEMDYEQALAAYQAAVEIDPKNEDAYIGMANAYVGLGDYDSAVKALAKGLEQTGDEELADYLAKIQEAAKRAQGQEKNQQEQKNPKPSYTQVGTTIHSGEIAGLTWVVTDEGELIVTGEVTNEADLQELWIFTEEEGGEGAGYWNLPWLEYSRDITIAYMAFSGATDLNHLFGGEVYSYDNLTYVDMQDMDTSNVTDMSGMFYNCRSLTSVDVGSMDTSNVTDMNNMFFNCSSLISVDLSNFTTSNVTDMGWMFAHCSITSLDLSSFDTSNVMNMSCMFFNCRSLRQILVGDDWQITDNCETDSMFFSCGVSEVTHK